MSIKDIFSTVLTVVQFGIAKSPPDVKTALCKFFSEKEIIDAKDELWGCGIPDIGRKHTRRTTANKLSKCAEAQDVIDGMMKFDKLDKPPCRFVTDVTGMVCVSQFNHIVDGFSRFDELANKLAEMADDSKNNSEHIFDLMNSMTRTTFLSAPVSGVLQLQGY